MQYCIYMYVMEVLCEWCRKHHFLYLQLTDSAAQSILSFIVSFLSLFTPNPPPCHSVISHSYPFPQTTLTGPLCTPFTLV